ncbi:MAG: hypothetical protein K8I27_07060 [Planctomycetes bacterium]|nr:hypothetical protein [Planctomycetota bacterium]
MLLLVVDWVSVGTMLIALLSAAIAFVSAWKAKDYKTEAKSAEVSLKAIATSAEESEKHGKKQTSLLESMSRSLERSVEVAQNGTPESKERLEKALADMKALIEEGVEEAKANAYYMGARG